MFHVRDGIRGLVTVDKNHQKTSKPWLFMCLCDSSPSPESHLKKATKSELVILCADLSADGICESMSESWLWKDKLAGWHLW